MTAGTAFSLRFYLTTLTRLSVNPRAVLAELQPEAGWSRPLGMLLVSSLLFAGACVIAQPGPQPVYLGPIYFANAVGMTLIAAGAGWLIITLMRGREIAFRRVFTIYALAAGITLLASWVPGLVLLTEAWKWWLIGTGMTRGLGLPRHQALTVVAISIALIILLFWSLQTLLPATG
jgi:hypothetical protein